MTVPRPRRVAIACQGGGSHTAFTAGVLKRLLGGDESEDIEVVALSGTSGGAVCALLAWYALLQDDPRGAGPLLDGFWADNSATSPVEQIFNSWLLWASELENLVIFPTVSPYDSFAAVAALDEFRLMLGRQVDFERTAVEGDEAQPLLLIGAVDVLSGEFRTFNSHQEAITSDMVLASAAIPTLFRSVPVNGVPYWDGLFSQNPPVRDLLDAQPDEIWVIQINPNQWEGEPRTIVEIADRRNELSGNLSLHQELRFIEKINQLLDEGQLDGAGKYRQVAVRLIELSRSQIPDSGGSASKLNRDPAFIRALIAHGEAEAEEFLATLAFEDTWRRGDAAAILGHFAADAVLTSGAPFAEAECRGLKAIGAFVRKQLTPAIHIDLTQKQVAHDRVTWTVRAHLDDPTARVQGTAVAEFCDGKVVALHLGS